jgi:hypothetical protein
MESRSNLLSIRGEQYLAGFLTTTDQVRTSKDQNCAMHITWDTPTQSGELSLP